MKLGSSFTPLQSKNKVLMVWISTLKAQVDHVTNLVHAKAKEFETHVKVKTHKKEVYKAATSINPTR